MGKVTSVVMSEGSKYGNVELLILAQLCVSQGVGDKLLNDQVKLIVNKNSGGILPLSDRRLILDFVSPIL